MTTKYLQGKKTVWFEISSSGGSDQPRYNTIAEARQALAKVTSTFEPRIIRVANDISGEHRSFVK
jgi:hypothetical protein